MGNRPVHWPYVPSSSALLLAALLFVPGASAAPVVAGSAVTTAATPLRAFAHGPIDAPAVRARGIELGANAGGWITLRAPAGRPDLLRDLPGARDIVFAPHCRIALDAAAVDTRLSLFRSFGPGGVVGPSGAGVLVGIIDTGIDLTHADFRNADGTTRIVSLWDQASTAGSPPPGFAYGSEWDSTAINAGSASSVDEEGHGTHVAGIAAGNGRGGTSGLDAGRYVGIAPAASLCVVRLDFSNPAGASAADVVDGVAYVFARAAALGMPAVVNLSLGTQEGPHDGTTPVEAMLSSMEGPGRIIVAAAGNEGAAPIHAQVVVPAGGTSQLTFLVPSYTPNAGAENDYVQISAWHDPTDSMDVSVVTPAGLTVGPLSAGSADYPTPAGEVSLCLGACTTPGVPASEISLHIHDANGVAPPAPGIWKFRVTRRVAGSTGRLDGYVADQILGSWAPWVSWQAGAVADGTLRSPATADSVIAVGAHITKPCWTDIDGSTQCDASASSAGQIAPFSSRGPRRDGVLKLDVTAPGMMIASTRSAAASFDASEIVPGGAHVVMEGTSMATPMVTGAAALLLARPGWETFGPTRLRDLLRGTARADGFTGSVPNNSWGYGKLDLLAAMSMTPTAVEGPATRVMPDARFALSNAAPNPFNPNTTATLDLARPSRVLVRVHAPSGALVRTLVRATLPAGPNRLSWDGRDERGVAVASGIYYVTATVEGVTVTRKVTLLK
jgi:subtilisin family serine protease